MDEDLIILGAGGTAREVLAWLVDFAAAGAPRRCLGLLDDDPALRGSSVGGVPVVGEIRDAGRWPHASWVDALGGPRSFRRRPEIVARAGTGDGRFATLVHPRAYVSSAATIGLGSLVFPHATIGAGARLGRHVVVLPGAVVSHDAQVGDFTIVASGALVSGGVSIGTACYIGTGSATRDGVVVGDGALVGMGAVVRSDVAPGDVVVGNPAAPLRRDERGS